jgi:hypothetical protein
VEPKAGDIHIRRLRGHLQQLQNTHGLPDLIRANTPRPACKVELFEPFVPEAADHRLSVDYLVYSVNFCSSLRMRELTERTGVEEEKPTQGYSSGSPDRDRLSCIAFLNSASSCSAARIFSTSSV